MKHPLLFLVVLSLACSDYRQRTFQFTYEVTIAPAAGKKLEVWLPIPQSNEVQRITDLKIDTRLNYQIKRESVHGNRYLYILAEEGIPAPETVALTFTVNRSEHGTVPYENVDAENYLGAYRLVPVGSVFDRIIRENRLSPDDMRHVYDFVLDGMHYGKPVLKENTDPYYASLPQVIKEGVTKDDVVDLHDRSEIENGTYTYGKGNSLYACNIGVGNCTDYHSYFMSLTRTMIIPSRFHIGFLIPRDSEGEIGGYHCWADFYTEGKGWTPVDISEADKHPEKTDYFFGTVCENRVEFSVGRDLTLENYDNGSVNFFIYPVLEVEDEIYDAITTKFYFQDQPK